jgi:tape measure domain-containing protein
MSADLGINLKAEGLAQFEADMKRAVQVTLAGAQMLKSGLAGVNAAILEAFSTNAVTNFEAELRKAAGVTDSQADSIGASVAGIDDAIEKAFDPKPLQDLQKEVKETEAVTAKKGRSISASFKEMFAAAGLALGMREVFQGIKALGREAIGGAISYESLNTQFEVFLGNADLAKTTLAELTKFSDVTPYEPDEVNASAKALLGLGIAQADLIPDLTMVGDIAAGVGANFQELSVAYGKAMGAGIVQNDILNQFQERGINVLRELGEMYGLTALQVKKMAEQNLLSSQDFKQALANMTGEGGKFNGMMDKMSQSTEGLLSTLRGNIKNALRSVGEALLPTIRAMVQFGLALPEFIKSHQNLIRAIAAMAGAAVAIKGLSIAIGFAKEAMVAYNFVVGIGPAIMRAYKAAVEALEAAQIAYSMATNKAAGAMKAFSILMNSNPWGLALTAIAAIGTAVYFLTQKTEELTAKQKIQNEVSRQIAEEYGKQAANSEVLFGKLKTLDKGSNEYKETIQAINTQYKEYLPYLLTNKSSLEEIKIAQDKLNASLMESIRLKIKEQTLTQVTSDFITKTQGNTMALVKQTGLTVAQIQNASTELAALAKSESFDNLADRLRKMQKDVADGKFNRTEADLRRLEQLQNTSIKEYQTMRDYGSEIFALNEPTRLVNELKNVKTLSEETRQTLAKLAGMTNKAKAEFLGLGVETRDYQKAVKEINDFFGESKILDKIKESGGGGGGGSTKEKEKIDPKSFAFDPFKYGDNPYSAYNMIISEEIDKIDGIREKFIREENAWLDELQPDPQKLKFRFIQPMTDAEFKALLLLEQQAKKTKELFASIRQAVNQEMARMAGDMAFAIGEALTSGGSPAEILRKTLREMAVQIPRMTGMALLNAATNPAYAYISPYLLATGLALLGASGLISGVFKASDKRKEAKVANAAAQSAMPNGQNAPAGLAAYSSGQSIGDQVSDALQKSTWTIYIGGLGFDAAVEMANRNNRIRKGQ